MVYCLMVQIRRALHEAGEVDDHQQTGNDDILKKSLGLSRPCSRLSQTDFL